MRFDNRFTLAVPVDVAWDALQDAARVARCVPGLRDRVLKVRLGSVATEYEGSLQLTEADVAAHRLVAVATGSERNAQGQGTATITAQLNGSGSGTTVVLTTDLAVTGRFGRFAPGVMGDLAASVVARFADRLAADLAQPQAADASTPTPAPTPAASTALSEVPPVPAEVPPVPAEVPPVPAVDPFSSPVLPAVAVGVMAAMAVSQHRWARLALGVVGVAAVGALARRARRSALSP